MPATNNCVTDVSAMTAYKIMGMDGGIMMASDAAEEQMAAANGALYPFFFISGIKTEPSAATSATADPEISAKNKDTPMLTCAKPPRIQPNSAEAKLIKRREIPDEFMMAPAKMNKGIASSGNFVAPLNMTIAMLGRLSTPCATTIAPVATKPNATAIGTLMSTIRRTMPKRINIVAISSLRFHR